MYVKVQFFVSADEDVFIELTGSPYSLTRQQPGVTYAVNCAGPAYQASTDITYDSEFKHFASFTFDNCYGKALFLTLLTRCQTCDF